MTDGALSLLAMPLASLEGDGSPPERGQQRLTGRYACYRVYECDGGGHYSVGALEPKFWSALCDALGRPDLVGEQYAEAEAGQRVHAEMEAIFRTRSRAEWEQVLQDLEVCCEPVLDLDEVAAHPQVAARGMVRREETGLEVAPAVPAAEVWRHRGAPALGEHTAEILAEVGVDDRRLRELREQGCI
jgi:crotonobetainyl-CoA:carnitine CoA-transferase CaiB-like acyl-CoA transferase